MDFLIFLSSIRNDVLTTMNMLITNFASEAIVIGVFCYLYWCRNKKYAYRLGFVYFISGIIVQTVKVAFRIPRPWILNSSFNPVKEAVPTATGYSFPSGHTQAGTALYGTIAFNSSKRIVQILMVVIMILIGFSRMYLGVHTPMDVAIAMVITITTICIINIVMDKKLIYKLRQETIMAVLLFIPIIMVAFAVFIMKNYTVEVKNILDYMKSSGAALGFAVGWYLESRYLNFDETRGSVIEKAIRLVVGILVILGLKSGIKVIIGDGLVAGFIRYAIIIFVGVYLYPLIFEKVERRKEKRV